MKRFPNRLFSRSGVVLLILSLTIISCDESSVKETVEEPIVIPYPAKVLKRSGKVTFEPNFWVVVDFSDSLVSRLGKNLVNEISSIPGSQAFIADFYSTRKHPQSIILELVDDPNQHPQGYTLSITSSQVEIKASTHQGIFYGTQTILSILNQNWNKKLGIINLQKMVVKDNPMVDFRVANLIDFPKSGNLDLLISKLGSLKINGLVLPESLNSELDLELLRTNYISVADQQKENQDYLLVEPRLEEFILPNSDTVYFSVKYHEDFIDSIELLVVSELGWSGNESKGMDWLNSRIDNKIENY